MKDALSLEAELVAFKEKLVSVGGWQRMKVNDKLELIEKLSREANKERIDFFTVAYCLYGEVILFKEIYGMFYEERANLAQAMERIKSLYFMYYETPLPQRDEQAIKEFFAESSSVVTRHSFARCGEGCKILILGEKKVIELDKVKPNREDSLREYPDDKKLGFLALLFSSKNTSGSCCDVSLIQTGGFLEIVSEYLVSSPIRRKISSFDIKSVTNKFGNVWRISWPVIVFSCLLRGSGVLTKSFIGGVSVSALAAVSAAAVLNAIFLEKPGRVVTYGLTSYLSDKVGKLKGCICEDYKLVCCIRDIKSLVSQGIVLTFAASFIFGTAGLLLNRWFLAGVMHLEGEALRLSVGYIRIIFLGSLFGIGDLASRLDFLFRLLDQHKLATMISSIAEVLLVLFSYLLIFGLICRPLGVYGFAIAIVLSSSIKISIFMYFLFKKGVKIKINEEHTCHIRLSKQYFKETDHFRKILIRGLPTFFEQGSMVLADLFLFRFVAGFGEFAVAAYGIMREIWMVILTPAFGFSQAATILVGESRGMNNDTLAKKIGWYCVFCQMMVGVLLPAIYLWPEIIIAFFSSNADVINIATLGIKILGFGFMFSSIGEILRRAFYGAGNTMFSMVMRVFARLGITVILAYFLSILLGVKGVFIAELLGQAVAVGGLIYGFQKILFMEKSSLSDSAASPLNICTFEEYVTDFTESRVEELTEIELLLMRQRYFQALDKAFIGAGDFREAYRLLYDVHEKHLTEGKVKPKAVKAYVSIVRRPFSSVKEIKDIVDVDGEWSISFLPEPDNWKGLRLYSFILCIVGGQLHMSFYDGNGLIREFNTDEETQTALRTIGLIGTRGLVVLVRSSFTEQLEGNVILGVASRISLEGHSHRKGCGVIPSRAHGLDDLADVELFALMVTNLPAGYPVDKYIPEVATRKQQDLDKDKNRKIYPIKKTTNTYLHKRGKDIVVRRESLPVNELVLYFRCLKAMYEETIGRYREPVDGNAYAHKYRAEFAGELAYHYSRFSTCLREMLKESFEGAFKILAKKIPANPMKGPGSLAQMMDIVKQIILECSTHPDLRPIAIALINDPRTYGLGDFVWAEAAVGEIEGKKTAMCATFAQKVQRLIGGVERRIIGQGRAKTGQSKEKKADSMLFIPADIISTEELVRRFELFRENIKGKRETRDEQEPSFEDVILAMAERLLILADGSVNDAPEIAEIVLRKYAKLVATFGEGIRFCVNVMLDDQENIMKSQALRPALIETAKSVPDIEDRNSILAQIAIQLTDEGDIKGALDLLEGIDGVTRYVFSDAVEQLADLLLVSGERNEEMIQQLERIIEKMPVFKFRVRFEYDERKMELFIKLGSKYYDLGMKDEANNRYRKAWELSARAEQPAVIRLKYFVPLMREKGLRFPCNKEKIISEAKCVGESEILNDPLRRSKILVMVVRAYAFDRNYEATERVMHFIKYNMAYPEDSLNYCYGAIIEAAALHGDNGRIDLAVSKMTCYVKDHFEGAAKLLVERGKYVKAMEFASFAMKRGYLGSRTVNYWGLTQVRIAEYILERDSTQIEIVRKALGIAIEKEGIGAKDLKQIIDMIVKYPQLYPDSQDTLGILQSSFEHNSSIIAHNIYRVILKQLRKIITERVRGVSNLPGNFPDASPDYTASP
ncbi:MAG: hypothetical protein JSV34_05515, partial [Candidatus Omnitrophota bacterium]